jgi:hypothetical protein
MIYDLIKDLILQNIGPLKQTRKGWKTRNCMLCHLHGESADRKGRFGIKFEEGKIGVHCFNCSFDASCETSKTLSKKFIIFLREIGVTDYDVKKINFELYREQNKIKATKAIELKGSITQSWVPNSLPKQSQTLMAWLEKGCEDPEFMKVVQYALDRKFADFHHLYWTPIETKFEYNKRLLLPFTYKGVVVGHTGRFADAAVQASTIRPKYINIMPDNYVYNLDSQSGWDRKYVILCEGVFDAYFVDGICSIGNTLNLDQIGLINRLGKKIIVCPDRDKDGGALVTHAIQQGWGVCFPNWEADIKDAAKAVEVYGRILTVQSIVQSAEFNPMKIELTWKLSKQSRNDDGKGRGKRV